MNLPAAFQAWLKDLLRTIAFWTFCVVLPGIASGLAMGWAEKHFGWSRGTGGKILMGIMAVAFVVGMYAFYRMLKEEIEEEF